MKSCTIGKFESFHKGHQKLIKTAKKYGTAEIISIWPFKEKRYPLFTIDERKILADLFEIKLINLPFKTIKNLLPEEFFSLLRKLNYSVLVVGTDWKFGKNRQGDVKLAGKLGKTYGIDVITIEPVKENGEKISTSRIKRLLSIGKVEKAKNLLGFPFFTTGKIKKGQGLGKKIGFPTINIKPQKQLLIPYGVYKIIFHINEIEHIGIGNFGIRPTVDGKNELLEIHIPNKNITIHPTEKIKIEFLNFIRSERKFSSIEELKKQIKLDLKSI